jgi:hypothetical protein
MEESSNQGINKYVICGHKDNIRYVMIVIKW